MDQIGLRRRRPHGFTRTFAMAETRSVERYDAMFLGDKIKYAAISKSSAIA